ncbi:serine/arginine repetitive matrix protein 2-like [Gigantopelta aegis]|uniref:serine/arginine repetitive matrix protein 2-like n=1 Tax=Gigantopelta aegis TaxID=1735272 RepID=UPI001B88DA6B|nr:serine/arginine repetitive matrix protein 2-like [Gigantopelta aegis]
MCMDLPSAPRQRGRVRVKSATRRRRRARSQSTSQQHGRPREESPPEQRGSARDHSREGKALVQSLEGQRGSSRIQSREGQRGRSRVLSPQRRHGRQQRRRSQSRHHRRAESQAPPQPRGRTRLLFVLSQLVQSWLESVKWKRGYAWQEMAPRLLLSFAAVLIVEASLEYLVVKWFEPELKTGVKSTEVIQEYCK